MRLLEQPKSQPLEEPYLCIWDACDAISSYAWNMQICTGKPEGGAAERNQGTRAVLDMSQGLSGHNIAYEKNVHVVQSGTRAFQKKDDNGWNNPENWVELQREVLTVKKRPFRSSNFMFTGNTALVSYRPK